jgi:hypothetical protein
MEDGSNFTHAVGEVRSLNVLDSVHLERISRAFDPDLTQKKRINT